MRIKKIKHAHTTLRWGLGLFVTGLLSFSLAIALMQNPLDASFLLRSLAKAGLYITLLGAILSIVTGLIFLPAVLKKITFHCKAPKKDFHSFFKTLAQFLHFLFTPLFIVWAFLSSRGNNYTDDGDTEPDIIDGDLEADNYYNQNPFYAYKWDDKDSDSLK